MAIEAARIAGWALTVRSSSSAGPSKARWLRGWPRTRSASANTAATAGEVEARDRAIPTDWEPCPGNTKATLLIPASLAAAAAAQRGIGAKLHTTRAGGKLPDMTSEPNSAEPASSVTVQAEPNLASRPRPRRSSHRRAAPVRAIARTFEADLSAPVLAAGSRPPNVRQLSERVAMGRALWRELVIGFASQLAELRLGFTQLAALYVLADTGTMTVGDLADVLGRSPSTASRLVDGLVRRRLVERHAETEDRRQRTLSLTQRGKAILRAVDRARADQFLTAVRPLPSGERALVAMGVAALARTAISRRGRLIAGRRT